MFKPSFKPELLPFAAFFATIPLYSPNIVSFTNALGMASLALGCFVQAMLASAFVAGLGLAVASIGHAVDRVVAGRRTVVASCVLYLGGFAVLAADGLNGGTSRALEAGAGVSCGLGLIVLCCAWGMRFSALDIRTGLLHVATTCGIGSLVSFMLASLEGVPYLVSLFAIVLIGLTTPLASAWQRTALSDRDHADCAAGGSLGDRPSEDLPDDGRNSMEGKDVAFAADRELALALSPRQPHETIWQTLRRLSSVAAAPFVGFIVFAFTMSVRKFNLFGGYDIELLAGIVAPIVVLPLCFARTRRPFLSFTHQQFLPYAALALVICNSFPIGSVVQIASASLTYVFFAVVGVIALASLCAVVHAREFPATLVFGTMLSAFSLVSLVGIAASQLFPDQDAGPALLVMSTVYFAGIILASIVALASQADVPVARKDDAQVPVESVLRSRCEAIARQSKLSPREAEILQYLGRGHNPTFVARTLVLSISTVRTHVRNIYRMINVSSQEELLALIDAQG